MAISLTEQLIERQHGLMHRVPFAAGRILAKGNAAVGVDLRRRHIIGESFRQPARHRIFGTLQLQVVGIFMEEYDPCIVRVHIAKAWNKYVRTPCPRSIKACHLARTSQFRDRAQAWQHEDVHQACVCELRIREFHQLTRRRVEALQRLGIELQLVRVFICVDDEVVGLRLVPRSMSLSSAHGRNRGQSYTYERSHRQAPQLRQIQTNALMLMRNGKA